MTEFIDGFVSGLKDGPRMFFAPLAGAVKGICAESQRVLTRPRVDELTASDDKKPAGDD